MGGKWKEPALPIELIDWEINNVLLKEWKKEL